MTEGTMLKLLCLHGYTQNGNVFRKRIAVLQKQLLKNNIECVFVDAPHVSTTTFNEVVTGEERAWWNASEDRQIYYGLDESLQYLKEFSDSNGPFDGILGFSQGAAMSSLIADHLPIKPKFLVLVGGFVPKPQQAKEILTYRGPSLHVMGIKDELVANEWSMNLAALMANLEYFPDSVNESGVVKVLVHDGGHAVPGKSNYRHTIVEWICAQYFAYLKSLALHDKTLPVDIVMETLVSVVMTSVGFCLADDPFYPISIEKSLSKTY
ncbi:serine hydrolase-domain-containing protein [Globomyces pollinis-pini]|nr:serine hydrolase-domain-containing protein [Globomyces pollinis-pini]